MNQKQPTISASSVLALQELTCSLIKPTSGRTLSLGDSTGIERLGLSSVAVFSCPVSMPSLDIGGSAIIGSSMILAGPLYLGGTDLAITLAQKQNALTSSTNLQTGTIAATGTISVSGASASTAGLDEGRLDFIRKDLNKVTFRFSDNNRHLKLTAVDPFNTLSWQVGQNGYCAFFAGFGNASDASLKDDVQDASTEDALHMLRTVSAKTYTRIDLPDEDGPRLGFIAQDMQAACPPLWSNLVSTTQYKWSDSSEETNIKILDYSRLTSVLWTVCKKKLARIEVLESKF